MMLMYFGSQLAFGNEDIPFCEKQLNELKDDVNYWRGRCMVNKYQEVDTTQCKEEKKYHQARMRKHSKQCFYEGNSISWNLVSYLRWLETLFEKCEKNGFEHNIVDYYRILKGKKNHNGT